MSDMYEIDASEMALQRSHRGDVRDFAQQMIKDHKKTTEEIEAMLGAMNEPMTLPSKPNTLFQTLLDDLAGASDRDFDGRYISQEKDTHAVAITLVKHYRDHGDDTALRELCRVALPVLEHHKHMIEPIAEAA